MNLPAVFSLCRRFSRLAPAAFFQLAVTGTAFARQPPPPPDYYVGNPGFGMPVAPPAPGQPAAAFAAASKNVRMFGALYAVESCTYDPVRNLIVAPSRGVPQ